MSKEKVKIGRPQFEPTVQHRKMVKAMAAYGITQDKIARILGLGSEVTLRKHFRDELDLGATEANAKVAESLYKNAVENDNVTAQIWWTKTRMRWRETVVNAHTGPDGEGPVQTVKRVIVDSQH